MNPLGWIKTIAEGAKAASDIVRAFLPKRLRSKPGPDVQPIRPEDLRKPPTRP